MELPGASARRSIGDLGRAPRTGVSSSGASCAHEQFGCEPDRLGVDREPWWWVELDPLLDEVPVGLEILGDTTDAASDAEPVELAQLHELAAAVDRAGRRVGIFEEPVEQVVPPLVEREVALELVANGEAGRQAGLDGELVQQPAGERVQRADRGVVEVVEGGGGKGGGVRLFRRRRPRRRSGRGAGDGGDRRRPSR